MPKSPRSDAICHLLDRAIADHRRAERLAWSKRERGRLACGATIDPDDLFSSEQRWDMVIEARRMLEYPQ